jgi:hypothetical protein
LKFSRVVAATKSPSSASLGATGTVISRVYNNEGTLIKYNGRNLGEDLNPSNNNGDFDI